ncbi:hypothetical protein Pcinc_012558 [Petrolisthes cinctipes]|uniref:MICOS complex subunit MIC60 n=1 Tax=Petrolisthes cinctipes TaxID=88211 RepID=A0AAE1KSG2_PETCI|nr:hypothetical protein Pcinc_012558 [Petrolisthes cinctipes]
MLHLSHRLRPHVASKVTRCGAGRRLQSTQSSGGGGKGKALIAVAGTTSLVAGVVSYSAWNDDNRKSVEGTLPGSKYLLNAILGPVVDYPAPKPLKPDVGLVKKRLEREKKKEAEKQATKEVSNEEAKLDATKTSQGSGELESGVVTPALVSSNEGESTSSISDAAAQNEATPSETSTVVEQSSGDASSTQGPSDVSDLESRMASGEVTEDVENASLSQALDDIASLAQKEVTAALTVAEDAAIVIRQHAEKAYQAIDAGLGKEQLFDAVAELSNKRAEVVKAAEDQIAAAGKVIEELSAQIENGLSSGLTKANKGLIVAEERLGDLMYAIQNIKTLITEAERDSKIVSSYRDLVDAGREQFESEVRSLLPEVKLGETSDKLTPDELNLLIAHAHRKVLQLQKQIARQKMVDHDRFKDAMNKQRDEDGKLHLAKLEAELERQKQLLEVENKRRVLHLREELEGELRTQLKRQAAAHSDHLADVLYVQEKELETKWTDLLQDQLSSEKDKYLSSLARVLGQLEGLKKGLVERADVDKAAYAARELWLACESLRNALRNSGDGAKSWEEQMKPLDEQISAIKTAAGEGNPYVIAVVDSLSPEAQERGVLTEEALRERFIKVERICKRVSMIGDNGGSLIRYFLSYIQSFFILNAFEYMPGNEVRNEEVPVDSLSTYDILARTRYCLDKDDLTLSVRYMNLLRGEPRNVASSWLKEARLTLETRQAADALLAHAAATAVKAL